MPWGKSGQKKHKKIVQRSFRNSEPGAHIYPEKKTSCVQKFHVSNECMFCIETTSDADNCLKRSQRSKQANKQQSFIDSSVKSDFIFRVMIHNKTYAVTVSRGADLETPPRVSVESTWWEKHSVASRRRDFYTSSSTVLMPVINNSSVASSSAAVIIYYIL